MADGNNTAWLAAMQLPGWSIRPQIWWLAQIASLSKVLASWGRVQIHISYQGVSSPRYDERTIFNRSSYKKLTTILTREVKICVNNQPMLLARTVIPWQDRQTIWNSTNILTTQPLGLNLFSDFSIERTPFVFAYAAKATGLSGKLKNRQTPPPQYGRRSIFLKHRRPLLLTEWFLPAFMQQMPDDLAAVQQLVNISKK